LHVAYEATAAGHGALIMLAGEPGIGKTALCEQLASFVSARSGLPLVGHWYPEGSAGVPYQPFVEIFESFAHEKRDVEALRMELGRPSVGEVARVAPALRNRLQVELPSSENPEDDRLRLLSGLLECLRGIGAARRVLLVLEDLHDADRGTLDLLVYLARHLASTPVFVVGTYRDVDVDRAHPLAATLADLRRISQFERVHLGELSVDEVQRLLATSSQQAIPRPLAELVHRRTAGNALFAHELLRFLLSEGLVEPRDGVLRRVDEASLAGQMPEGLRDVVGRRLSRLSPEANQMLSIASVIGREFSLDVLRRVHGRPDELEGALEEAVGAVMVEERSAVASMITYRFTHAFFQQTLYDEILGPRRMRLHQQIARALEEVHARRLDEHAAELAEQYAFSSAAPDLVKAVSYGEMAARRATEVFAYGEAARQLERALAVQDLVDPDDAARQCDLLLAQGEALYSAGETERVIAQVAPDALKRANAIGDRSRAFRACRLALDCLFLRGIASAPALPAYITWAERASDYAEHDSIERVQADQALALAWWGQGRLRGMRALLLESLNLARRLGDPETLFRAAFLLLAQCAPQHWEERVRLAAEVPSWPRPGVSTQPLGQLLWACGLVQLGQGDRARAEDLWRQVDQLAGRTRVARLGLIARSEAILAIVDGHLEDAVAMAGRLLESAEELSRQFGVQMLLTVALYLGRPEIYLSAFEKYAREVSPDWKASPFVIFSAGRAICLAQLGHLDEARKVAGPVLDGIQPGDVVDEMAVPLLATLLRAAVLLEHHAAARALAARLAGVAHVVADFLLYTAIGRHLGDAAALAGNRAAARDYYAEALETADKIRFRPELAMTHLRLAELLLQDSDDHARSEALEHLNLAIPELRDMHMQHALERALALSDTRDQGSGQAVLRASAAESLTTREREITGLMADGRSNREIAERLVITEGTVEVHVKHILSKLGLRSRTQVATWIADHRSEIRADDRG
jgi:predicted ATPase